MTSMIRTAALATALLLTTTLAAQAGPFDHWKRPKLDTTTTQGINESTSPGDPFFPFDNEGRRPKPILPSVEIKAIEVYCAVAAVNPDSVYFMNTTDETLPAGTVISWKVTPGGASGTYVLNFDMPPGMGLYIKNVLNGIGPENTGCMVTATSPEMPPEIRQGLIP